MNPVTSAHTLPAVLAVGLIALIAFNATAESPVEKRWPVVSDASHSAAAHCMPVAYSLVEAASDHLHRPDRTDAQGASAIGPAGSHGSAGSSVNAELLQPFSVYPGLGHYLTLAPNQAPPEGIGEPATSADVGRSTDTIDAGLRFVF